MRDNKNRVAFMNTHKGWGGGEKWHFEAACFFSDLGYDITFICRKDSVLEKRLSEKGIICQHFCVSNLSFLNPLKIYLLNILLRKVVVLIVNSPADNKLAGVTSVFHKKLKIIFRRGMPHPVSPSFVNRWLFRSCIYRVIANSETVKDSLNFLDESLIEKEKIVVIYNGFNVEACEGKTVKSDCFKENDATILLTCGRLVEQKNHMLLLKAAKILAERGEIFHLVIVGDGPLKNVLQKYVVDNNLSDKCTFLGFVDDVQRVLACSDIFLLPSFYEGSSNALIEACGSALPAVVSDIASNREIVVNNVSGFCLPVDDVDKWADSILLLIRNEAKREQFGICGHEKVKSRFSMVDNRKKLRDLVDESAIS